MATTYLRTGGGVVEASKLIGCAVETPRGERVGSIEGLMIDLSESRVLYSVLSLGGIKGMKDKLFPLPLNALSFRKEKDGTLERCILNVDLETFKDAPECVRGKLPDAADRTFASKVYTHYGYTPYWEE